RQKSLYDQQLVAGATLDQFQVEYDTAQAQIVASKAEISRASANLKQARTNLGYATIYSPVDGVVLSRAVDVGQTVAASLQAPTLFTIAEDLARMQINTAVAEGDVGALKENIKATFTVDAFPGKTFEGVVRQVRNAPTTNQGVVTYDAVIDVENKDLQLRPGMTANVTFVLEKVENAVKIPNAALRFKPSRDQMVAIFEKFGGGPRGRRNGSGGPRGDGERGSGERGSGERGRRNGSDAPDGSGGGPRTADAMTSASGGAMRAMGDRKPLWKLVDGKPQMTFVKLGLTDGSSTQMVEGDIKPGDQLITEVQG